MALSSEEKQKIIFVLGHTGKILIPTSTHFSQIIADRMINLNVEIEDEVQNLLALIDTTRTKLTSIRDKGNVTRIGDIELDTSRSRTLVTSDYKRLLRELGCLLDIPVLFKIGGGSFNVCGP